MAQTVEGLRLFQWGVESTRGTAVAATSKMAVENVEFEPIDSVYRPKLAKGLLHRNPGSEVIIQRGTTFRIPETPVAYDQLQNFLQMSVKGGVTASGSPSVYTWAFARSLTADPACNSFTLERRLTDGSSPKDNEWAYCMLSQIRFTYQIDRPLMFSAEGFARRVQASTLTAAQAMPTIEEPPVPLATAFIDTTWAGLGGTQVSGQVLRADVTFKTGLKPKFAFDGRTDQDFSTYVLDASEVGLDVELVMMVAGQYSTEKTAAEALTLRAMRLAIAGSGSRSLNLDMLLKHEKGSLFAVAAEDGQDIVTMKLQDTDDGTNMFAATVINAVGTMV